MRHKLTITIAIAAAFAALPAAGQQSQNMQGSNQQIAQEQAAGTGAIIFVSPAGVRQMQQELNKRGFDVDKVNGEWTKATARAAAAFQKTHGLVPTGTLTVALIDALGVTNLLTDGPGGSQASKSDNAKQGNSAGGGQFQGGDMQWVQEAASGNGTPIYISPAGIRQIQQALNQQGYSIERVDGTWGEATAQAARNFQEAQGLAPTGELNVRLITHLGGQQQVLAFRQKQDGKNAGGSTSGQTKTKQGATASQNSRSSDMQWSQEQVAGWGEPLRVSPTRLRQIEQQLNQLGFDAGNVDGQWDRQVRLAVRKYQKTQGLVPTGTLTTAFLANMGMAEWMRGQGNQQGGQQQDSGWF